MALPTSPTGSWTKDFGLPNLFDRDRADDGIEASYTNGVLEVALPVAAGAAPGRSIPIEG
jgi:HSP20 family molecular chaperone IbpA